eukprot:scaffold20931_cov54-Phaeocystis_antarctica.AAC.4
MAKRTLLWGRSQGHRGGGWAPIGRQVARPHPGSTELIPSCPESTDAPCGGAGAELGHCQGGHCDHAAVPAAGLGSGLGLAVRVGVGVGVRVGVRVRVRVWVR